MLGHVSIRVANREESADFYLQALSPLSYTAMKFPEVTGIGPSDSSVPIPNLWLRQLAPKEGDDPAKPTPIHISFYVEERRLVDEFYTKALAAGGTDNGKPGVRAFFPNYYGK